MPCTYYPYPRFLCCDIIASHLFPILQNILRASLLTPADIDRFGVRVAGMRGNEEGYCNRGGVKVCCYYYVLLETVVYLN